MDDSVSNDKIIEYLETKQSTFTKLQKFRINCLLESYAKKLV